MNRRIDERSRRPMYWTCCEILLTPFLAPSLYLMLLPIVRRWRVRTPGERAAARRLAGQCEQCGYDLRGSRVRCPECGRPR